MCVCSTRLQQHMLHKYAPIMIITILLLHGLLCNNHQKSTVTVIIAIVGSHELFIVQTTSNTALGYINAVLNAYKIAHCLLSRACNEVLGI